MGFFSDLLKRTPPSSPTASATTSPTFSEKVSNFKIVSQTKKTSDIPILNASKLYDEEHKLTGNTISAYGTEDNIDISQKQKTADCKIFVTDTNAKKIKELIATKIQRERKIYDSNKFNIRNNFKVKLKELGEKWVGNLKQVTNGLAENNYEKASGTVKEGWSKNIEKWTNSIQEIETKIIGPILETSQKKEVLGIQINVQDVIKQLLKDKSRYEQYVKEDVDSIINGVTFSKIQARKQFDTYQNSLLKQLNTTASVFNTDINDLVKRTEHDLELATNTFNTSVNKSGEKSEIIVRDTISSDIKCLVFIKTEAVNGITNDVKRSGVVTKISLADKKITVQYDKSGNSGQTTDTFSFTNVCIDENTNETNEISENKIKQKEIAKNQALTREQSREDARPQVLAREQALKQEREQIQKQEQERIKNEARTKAQREAREQSKAKAIASVKAVTTEKEGDTKGETKEGETKEGETKEGETKEADTKVETGEVAKPVIHLNINAKESETNIDTKVDETKNTFKLPPLPLTKAQTTALKGGSHKHIQYANELSDSATSENLQICE